MYVGCFIAVHLLGQGGNSLGANVSKNLLVLALASGDAVAIEKGDSQKVMSLILAQRRNRFRNSVCKSVQKNGPVRVLVEHGGVLLLRGNDTNFAGELERALDHVVRHNVELLLLLALWKTSVKKGLRSQARDPQDHTPGH
jgi:hypothetical protein